MVYRVSPLPHRLIRISVSNNARFRTKRYEPPARVRRVGMVVTEINEYTRGEK